MVSSEHEVNILVPATYMYLRYSKAEGDRAKIMSWGAVHSEGVLHIQGSHFGP